MEEGSRMAGQGAIHAPWGEIVAHAVSRADEVITVICDLDLGRRSFGSIFNVAKHRERKGAIPPPEG